MPMFRVNQCLQAVLIVIIIVIIGPVLAQGQDLSSSFEALRANPGLARGDQVRVVSRDGGTVRGRVESIDSESLVVMSGRNRLEISEASALRIWKQQPDSRWNGGLIGLGAGLAVGFGVLAARCSDDQECRANAAYLLVPAFAAGGAIVGDAIDGFTHRYDPVFEAPVQARSQGLWISPVVDWQRKGIQLSFSF